MPNSEKPLGILRPLGGGDPVPLHKEEMIVGRRPKCDIRLDFENISGRHCQLMFVKGVWHVRDLGSTNGTTVNGQIVAHEQGLMPDDELGLANHFFTIDYEPIAPTSLLDANQVLEEEIAETRRHSLMELAGLEGNESNRRSRWSRPSRASEKTERLSRDDMTEFDDNLPGDFKPGDNKKPIATNDDDFFRIIQDDVEETKPRKSSGQ